MARTKVPEALPRIKKEGQQAGSPGPANDAARTSSSSQYAAKKRAVQAAKAPSQAKSKTQKELKAIGQVKDKVKRKAKAGVKALREIREYQKSVKLLIPKAPMRRLIREITETFGGDVIDRWTSSALEAVQEVAEAYMVAYFERSQLAAIHGKRITIMPKDMDLVKRMAVDL
ncbi:histone domain-containing protein, partial [Haematococcus lacustris]